MPYSPCLTLTALAVVLTLGACGSDGTDSARRKASSGQQTSTGYIVTLPGGGTIRYPGTRPKGAQGATPPAAKRPVGQAASVGASAPASWRATLATALATGRRAADALGGHTDAAVWAGGWSAPLVSGDGSRRARMWSMFKPIAVIAALRAASDAGKPGGSDETRAAMELALRRSDNCAARRVVLSLQQLTGSSAAAAARVRAVLTSAGSDAQVATTTGAADAVCRPYLQASRNITDPLAPGLQLGTSTWSVRDAVAFAHGLATGRYGSEGAQVQTWMREPKARAAQVPAAQYTVADPEWGAGRVLADRAPAFKGGWGGTQQHDFVVGQIATFNAGKTRIAMAVYFHPDAQPTLDDPGRTPAPAALEAVFGSVDAALRRLTSG